MQAKAQPQSNLIRTQLEMDREELRRLWERLNRTREVMQRALEAYTESRILLERFPD